MFKYFFLLILSFSLCLPLQVWSEEEAAEETEESAEALATDSKMEREFTQKTTRLNTLKSRIDEAEKSFELAVRDKQKTKSEDDRRELMKQMVELHKDRTKNVKEYNELRREIQYQYPGQGAQIERKFAPRAEKSMEDLEKVSLLDERLNEAGAVVESKYKKFMPKEERPKPKPAQSKAGGAKNAEPAKKLRLEK